MRARRRRFITRTAYSYMSHIKQKKDEIFIKCTLVLFPTFEIKVRAGVGLDRTAGDNIFLIFLLKSDID